MLTGCSYDKKGQPVARSHNKPRCPATSAQTPHTFVRPGGYAYYATVRAATSSASADLGQCPAPFFVPEDKYIGALIEMGRPTVDQGGKTIVQCEYYGGQRGYTCVYDGATGQALEGWYKGEKLDGPCVKQSAVVSDPSHGVATPVRRMRPKHCAERAGSLLIALADRCRISG